MNDLRPNPDERFHPLVEATSAAMFVLESGRIVYINPASKELTGRTARELIGSPLGNFLRPRYRPLVEKPVGEGLHSQVQLVGKAGELTWVDLTVRPFIYRGVPSTLATAIDVADLKESDLARRDAEVQLKLVQRAGRTVSWDWNASTDELVVYGLPGKLITHGAPVLTTTAKAVFENLDGDGSLALKHAMRHSLADRKPLFIEIALRSPEDGDRRVVLRGQPIPDPSGQRGHIVGVATDVTERYRAEEALILEQQQKLAMLASISDGVIRTDLEGTIEDMTATAESVTGLSLDEVRGSLLSKVITLVDQESGEKLQDPIELCLENMDRISQPQTAMIRLSGIHDIPVRFHTALLRDRNATPIGAFLVLKDLVEHKQFERSLVYLATHDPLTDLLNRGEFERQLGQALSSNRAADHQDALLYMDLDGFKLLNTTFGYPAGNKMLKQFSSFLKTRFRETDTLGRIGGDKFGILLENCGPRQARELIEKIYQDMRSFRFEWEESTIAVSLSTGMTGLSAEDIDPERALGAAEAACYLAKQKGGNSFYEYEAKDVSTSERHTQLEVLHQIQDALRSDSFQLFAQEITPLVAPDANPVIYEILLRMEDRSGKLILPDRFIPVAERLRIMTAVDRWVVTRALEVVSERVRIRNDESTLFAINISGQSLGDDRFLEYILNQLSYRGVDPGRICIEITETASVDNFDRAQRFISVLKGHGCRFVLDDFGSGLSSFAYLRKLPVDFIKIDGQFIQGLSKDPTSRALVESINHVGHVMNIKTIAESVEHPHMLDLLREMKVDYAQGHCISFPEPIENILLHQDSDSMPSDPTTHLA
jgi:diguanylate cyclase (GGDEF)-like protein/PAS domain S-box-containing protein